MIKTCVVCGKEFATKTARLTCGEACSRPRRKAQMERKRDEWRKRNPDRYVEYKRQYGVKQRAIVRAAKELGLI